MLYVRGLALHRPTTLCIQYPPHYKWKKSWAAFIKCNALGGFIFKNIESWCPSVVFKRNRIFTNCFCRFVDFPCDTGFIFGALTKHSTDFTKICLTWKTLYVTSWLVTVAHENRWWNSFTCSRSTLLAFSSIVSIWGWGYFIDFLYDTFEA